jgi:hypothetical protein
MKVWKRQTENSRGKHDHVTLLRYKPHRKDVRKTKEMPRLAPNLLLSSYLTARERERKSGIMETRHCGGPVDDS